MTNRNSAHQWKSDSAAGLDPSANRTDFWEDNDGQGWDLKQERTYNNANETTEMSKSLGSNWTARLQSLGDAGLGVMCIVGANMK